MTIAAPLLPLSVDIESIEQHPRNPRRGDIPAIRASLRDFGQMSPVVVQASTRYIVAGNHVVQAAIALGWKTIAAVFVDLDDEDAGAFLLADNRLADLAQYDTPSLITILAELASEDALSGTGFTLTELNAMLAVDTGPDLGAGDQKVSFRTFTVTLPVAQAEELLGWGNGLADRWGLSGIGPVILRAVEQQAKA